jgi:hypothetical protein
MDSCPVCGVRSTPYRYLEGVDHLVSLLHIISNEILGMTTVMLDQIEITCMHAWRIVPDLCVARKHSGLLPVKFYKIIADLLQQI